MKSRARSAALKERITAMALSGMRPVEIEAAIGGAKHRDSIRVMLTGLRKKGIPIPDFEKRKRIDPAKLRIPLAVLDSFTDAAVARGIRTDALAARLLSIIAKDNMVDAILDDGAGANV